MFLRDNALDSRELLSGLLVVQVLQTGIFSPRYKHLQVASNQPFD